MPASSTLRPTNPYVVQVLQASTTMTASTNGDVQDGFGQSTALRLQLEVTAASGTLPTLDVTIEDTLDGTNWNTVATFTQKTTTGLQVINLLAGTTPYADRLRVKTVIGGTTPSFTFSVKGYARWIVS